MSTSALEQRRADARRARTDRHRRGLLQAEERRRELRAEHLARQRRVALAKRVSAGAR